MFKVSSIISGAKHNENYYQNDDRACDKIARAVKANAFLICVDISTDIASLSEEIKKNKKVIIVSREKQELPEDIKKYAHKLDVPNVNLTRLGKIKIAAAKGIVLGFFKKGDKIVAISGVPKFGYADSIFVIDVGKEFEILTSDFINDVLEDIQPEVFNAVLNLACELAAQGREYRKVGTIFVLEMMRRSCRVSANDY